MDKRQEKTLIAIYQAFTKLLIIKDYQDIIIQDILDESKVGRSTFYSHFKAKDELISRLVEDICQTVSGDYKNQISNIFLRIYKNRELVTGIMKSTAKDLFLKKLKDSLETIINRYYLNNPLKEYDSISIDLKKSLAVELYITALNYWIKSEYKETPLEMSKYYLDIFRGLQR